MEDCGRYLSIRHTTRTHIRPRLTTPPPQKSSTLPKIKQSANHCIGTTSSSRKGLGSNLRNIFVQAILQDEEQKRKKQVCKRKRVDAALGIDPQSLRTPASPSSPSSSSSLSNKLFVVTAIVVIVGFILTRPHILRFRMPLPRCDRSIIGR